MPRIGEPGRKCDVDFDPAPGSGVTAGTGGSDLRGAGEGGTIAETWRAMDKGVTAHKAA